MTAENNPIYHAQKIKAQMRQLLEPLRAGVGKVAEPKAQEFVNKKLIRVASIDTPA